MFKAAITIYILAVVAYSAMANASMPLISDVDYNAANSQLKIRGLINNTCPELMIPQVLNQKPSSLEGEVVTIEIKAESQDFCATPALLDRAFDLSLDVKSLPLPQGRNIKIKFSNPFLKAPQSVDVLIPENNSETFVFQTTKGQIVAMNDGKYALVVNENEHYQLKSSMDLSDYVGQYVSIDGFELNFKVGPALGSTQLDPLPLMDSMSDATLFYVSSVSSISE